MHSLLIISLSHLLSALKTLPVDRNYCLHARSDAARFVNHSIKPIRYLNFSWLTFCYLIQHWLHIRISWWQLETKQNKTMTGFHLRPTKSKPLKKRPSFSAFLELPSHSAVQSEWRTTATKKAHLVGYVNLGKSPRLWTSVFLSVYLRSYSRWSLAGLAV